MRLKNKIVVVTGGAGLVGKSFCEAITRNGGVAIIADINYKEAVKVSESMEGSFPVFLDICSEKSISEMLEKVLTRFSRIDCLVNNAYPRNENYGRDFLEVTYEDFCENLSLNMGGYFLMTQQLLKYFLKVGTGNIVNISSIYGVVPPSFEIYEGAGFTMPVEYSVIKSGVIHFSKYVARYTKGKNIRVNVLTPGGVLNGQSVVFVEKYKSKCLNQGMLKSGDLTGGLVFLISDESKMMNGQNLIIDDGFTL